MSAFLSDDDCNWTLDDVGILGEAAVEDRYPAEQLGNDQSTPFWVDAQLTDELVVDGEFIADEDAPIQTKMCAWRVRDGATRRQGRWCIYRDSFEKLVEAGGLIALGVHDPELGDANPIVLDMFYPESLEGLGMTWVSNGNRDVARVRWGRVFSANLVDDTREAML